MCSVLIVGTILLDHELAFVTKWVRSVASIHTIAQGSILYHCINYFLISVAKYSTRSNWTEDRFILAHSMT